MRNLKKVLSLALALVMLLGMMVVGAGAATSFKDDASIKNQVAVAVTNTIGVLKGDENGNFNPDDTLDRAQAAVAIARLDLGASAADALAATNAATFNDVPVSHWGKPYIDYCAGNGYIVGDGNGNFLPNKTVSSVEFALMVARVLGYNTKNEGIDGEANWAVKAAALARKAGLSTNVVLNTTDGMTRDDMAQMVFNSLTASLVEYEGLNVSVNGVDITSSLKVRTHSVDQGGLYSNKTYDGKTPTPTTPIRLCEERFPYLKLRTTEEDNFGHTASVWKYREAEIAGSDTTVAADIVLTGKVLKSLPDWAKIKSLTKASGAQLFINGDTSTAVPANADAILPLTGNGRLVEIYLNEADMTQFDKIVITDTALAEVTKVVDSEETISVKLVKSAVTDGNVVLNTKEGYGDVKKGDLVLVQGYSTADPKLNAKTTVTSVTEPTVTTGFATIKKYSAADEATYIKVAGDDYYDAKGVMEKFTIDDFNLNTEFDSTLYLDQYGYIMKAIQGVDPNLTTDNLVAVKKAYKTLTDGAIVDMIQGVISNGQTVTWRVSTAATKNTIYSYTKANGEYTLTPVAANRTLTADQVKGTSDTYVANAYTALDTDTVNFKSNDVYGKENGGTYMYSDTVKFIFVDGTNDSVTVVNGRQNYNFTQGDTKIIAQALKDGEITAVFVTGEADVADLKDVIFVSSRYREWDEVITRDNGTKVQYYGYTAYTSDGEAIDHFLGTEPDMDHSGTGYFYIIDKNDDGAYKPTHPTMLNKHTMISGDLQKANGTAGDAFILKVGNQLHEFVGRSSAVVKDLTTADAKLYIESIPELNAAKNNGYDLTIAVLYNETDTAAVTAGAGKVKEAKTVFVTKAVKSGTTTDPDPDPDPTPTPTGKYSSVVDETAAAKITGDPLNLDKAKVDDTNTLILPAHYGQNVKQQLLDALAHLGYTVTSASYNSTSKVWTFGVTKSGRTESITCDVTKNTGNIGASAAEYALVTIGTEKQYVAVGSKATVTQPTTNPGTGLIVKATGDSNFAYADYTTGYTAVTGKDAEIKLGYVAVNSTGVSVTAADFDTPVIFIGDATTGTALDTNTYAPAGSKIKLVFKVASGADIDLAASAGTGTAATFATAKGADTTNGVTASEPIACSNTAMVDGTPSATLLTFKSGAGSKLDKGVDTVTVTYQLADKDLKTAITFTAKT